VTISANLLADRVAALDVDGVTIWDLDHVPQAIDPRACPQVYPVPEKFLKLDDSLQISFGPNGLWMHTYTATFRCVQSPVGKERRLSKILPSQVNAYVAFIKAVTHNAQLLGAAHVKPANTPEWGVLEDASKAQFNAADLALTIVEYSAD